MFESINKVNKKTEAVSNVSGANIEENAKAVLKLNKKAGDLIEASDLENPMHFDKLIDSKLIKINNEVLTVKEVIGKKLVKDVVALTPVVGEMLEGFVAKKAVSNNNAISNSTVRKVMEVKELIFKFH